ncbi:50S ribosomal protein L29 [bacterium]|nr:50S ribosomal protein L29 [bacterium]
MKKAELKNWREKQPQEIEAQLRDLSAKLTSAYLTKSAGKLQNVSMIKNFRREIAQLKTILAQKQAEVSES